MKLAVRFAFLFALSLLAPHVDHGWRWPFLIVFAYTICTVLWRDLRPERDSE